ncbi:hypothetical protein L210DRAFT_3553945 [Boletus edulis BED1]|uniref:Uncharacterized protein n=1 Tax=Boletus edulis BED1 TaxID=1328754 RepID=A0AAD4BM93_BOLED|nr:hypothetical protein L210DRAFT_3553945 [Boletus edulis BED1]
MQKSSRHTAATPRSGDSSVLTDSCGPPTQSSPPTVIAPSPSSANTTAGSDGTSKISSPTNGTWAEVSYMTGVPTIISRDATTSSMAMLASLMDRQVSSFTGISENSHRSRMMVRRAMEISRTFLSSPGRQSQLCPPTTPKTMGINVSQLRNLFTPKLDKNAKRSAHFHLGFGYLSRFHFLFSVLARGPSVCTIFLFS